MHLTLAALALAAAAPAAAAAPDQAALARRALADVLLPGYQRLADTTETQTVCAAADLTIRVVAKGSSRAGDVTSAVAALANAHAVLLGAVMIDATNGR